MRLSENLLKTYKIRQILFFLDQLSTRPSFNYTVKDAQPINGRCFINKKFAFVKTIRKIVNKSGHLIFQIKSSISLRFV